MSPKLYAKIKRIILSPKSIFTNKRIYNIARNFVEDKLYKYVRRLTCYYYYKCQVSKITFSSQMKFITVSEKMT